MADDQRIVMDAMSMEPGEIANAYRLGKDKLEQLVILAQLNLCSVEKIADTVRSYGISVPLELQGDAESLIKHYGRGKRPVRKKEVKPMASNKPAEPGSVQLTAGETESLLDFLDNTFLSFLQEDKDYDSIEWIGNMCTVYRKLEAAMTEARNAEKETKE